jgi:hypothetical protein
VHPLFKGAIKLILTVIGQFIFCPVYQKCWNNLSIINWLTFLMSMQSFFHSGYGCATATLTVLNDVTIALNSTQCYAAIFIDLAKALDTVDHSILVGLLRSIGVSEGSLAWFANYLSKSAVYEVRTSAVSATACHQGSTPRLYPRPYALFNLHQHHSSSSRKLSHPFICRWHSLILSWPLPGFCVKHSMTKLSLCPTSFLCP